MLRIGRVPVSALRSRAVHGGHYVASEVEQGGHSVVFSSPSSLDSPYRMSSSSHTLGGDDE